MIYSFTTVNVPTGDPGWTYYMGRPDDDATPIKLNISPTGKLDFRPPSAQGGTPVGTVAEMQFINTGTTTVTREDALKGNYYQEADIDLLGGANIDTTAQNPQTGSPMEKLNWTPIGKPNPFTGTFDGNKKSLDNISVNETSGGVGLFGYLDGSALLQNIRLESGSVTGGGNDVGGISAGQAGATASIRIINCSNGADVSGGGGAVGGIIGWPQNGAFIAGCRNSGEVTGNSDAGGISGGDDAVITITACYNTGEITAISHGGGIAGTQGQGSITACYNDGPITANFYPGGIKGFAAAPVSGCYCNSAMSSAEGGGTFYDGDSDFPNVSAVSGWETSLDGSNGKYWKPGTTTGGQLPKLWWE
jgi:hypothetical protein